MSPKGKDSGSEIKSLLKQANKALTSKKPDPETALELCTSVLKKDKENYYGWLFSGMAFYTLAKDDNNDIGDLKNKKETPDDQLNNNYRKAIKNLERAIELNPTAVYPFKTLVQISALDPDFVSFFSYVEKYAIALSLKFKSDNNLEEEEEDNNNTNTNDYPLDSDSLNELQHLILNYIDKFDYKNNPTLHVHYLKHIIPHFTILGTIIGERISPAAKSVTELIEIYEKDEKLEIDRIINREKRTWPVGVSADKDFLRRANIKWSIYKDSKIIKENLWDTLVEFEAQEDEKNKDATESKRWNAMAKQVDYLNKLLAVAPDGSARFASIKPTEQLKKGILVIGKKKEEKAPAKPEIPKDEKTPIREKIQDLLSTLVLLRAPIKSIWDQYFDWLDPETLSDLDLQEVVTYIKLFDRGNGLAKLLYYFAYSDISPWDKAKVDKYFTTGRSKKNRKSRNNKEIKGIENNAFDPQQVFTAMIEAINFKDTSNFLLASRIYLTYCIHIQEYQIAIDFCRNVAVLMSNLKLKTGVKTTRSRRDYTFNLAIIYTYHESPKNFSKAEKLYVEILKDEPHNIKALIGMGRIKMETGYFSDAKQMFENVLSEVSKAEESVGKNIDIGDILMEYGWSCINMGEFDSGRNSLQRALELFTTPRKLKDSAKQRTVEDEENTEEEENTADEDEYHEEETNENDEKENTSFSAASLEVKATLYYRLAMSYIMQIEANPLMESEMEASSIRKAFSFLIQCLKTSNTFASAYTALGELYANQVDNSENENENEIENESIKNKSFRCFYRAFELDPGELRSSYGITEHFADKKDWEMVELICTAVIENEKARSLILKSTKSTSNDNSVNYHSPWPYRLLGIVCMERQEDDKAIEFFQSALRIAPADISSWIGLGEAYLSRGKIESSKKVFSHVIFLESGISDIKIDTTQDIALTTEILSSANWHAVYLLSNAESIMGEYSTAIDLLVGLINRNQFGNPEEKGELCVLTLLSETLIRRAAKEIINGAITRSMDTLQDAFTYFIRAFKIERKSLKLWKNFSDALVICLSVQSHIEKLPFDSIISIFEISNESIKKFDEVVKDSWVTTGMEGSHMLIKLHEDNLNVDMIHCSLVLASYEAILSLPENCTKKLRASLIYNLSVAFTLWNRGTQTEKFTKAIISLLQKAIHLEGANACYWNALGLACMNENARVAQHCFINASSMDSKSPNIWFNLGMLYVKYNDYELANQSFIRAQSLAPGISSGWEGQAIVAAETGDTNLALSLFTHSFVISNGRNPSNNMFYATEIMSKTITNASDERDLDAVQQLTSANHGILNYLKFYPGDLFALKVAVSITERLQTFDKGLQLSNKICSILEQKFEEEESDDVLLNYTIAKAQLSRIQLGHKQFEESLVTSGEVGGLLDEISERTGLTEEIQKLTLSSYTVTGLAKYFMGDFDGSLKEFQTIIEAFPESRRVVVLIAQVLYALGSDDTKEAAMEELLSNIKGQGTSLLVVLTIAAIAIVENWDEYLEAVKDDLDNLPLETRMKDTFKEVPMFLDAINTKLGIKNIRIWQRNAIMFPSETSIWKHLDDKVALNVAKGGKNVDAKTLSEAYLNVGGLREIQRGMILDPALGMKKLELLKESV
ncbi:SKI complex subunit tetratricopeptide repeat protein [Martiniozyma asiatica (nom. inval.)]|nr:SKI complex subunit tetratricopeptide repeat protein [Martiniozyma asiatica]